MPQGAIAGAIMQLRSDIGWLLVFALIGSAHAQTRPAPVICLSTLEWPPYVSARLPDQGASAHVLRSALARKGIALHLSFYPWRRAVALAGKPGSGIHGYFPEYRSPQVETRFELSAALGQGPLGLAIRMDSAFDWQSYDDLLGYRLGVVAGYVNTARLDADIASGRQPVLVAGDDATNLRRLAIGRIAAAVIDANVFTYLLANEPRLRATDSRLRMHPRMLEEKSLHIAFARTPAGARAARVTALALRDFDTAALQAEYLRADPRPAPIPVGDVQNEVPCAAVTDPGLE